MAILVALSVGLPALAHAHGSHAHEAGLLPVSGQAAQVSGQTSEADRGTPAETQTMQAMVEATISAASDLTATRRNAVAAGLHAASQQAASPEASQASFVRSAGQTCVGGCCCLGMSGCGMGACCHQFLTADGYTFDLAAVAQVDPMRALQSISLLVILGLDRPPKD